MNARRAALGTVLAVWVAACAGPTDAERGTVNRWLLCEECSDGELDSVVALGGGIVGLLGQTLRGPTPDRFENVRRQALTSYRSLVEEAQTSGGAVSVGEAVYVRNFLENYVATYQVRSAVALGRIGTPGARNLLVSAMQSDSLYRGDVRRAIGDALGDSLLIQDGNNQVATQNTQVAVAPSVKVTSSTGASVEGIRVQFVVDSGGGSITDSIVFTDTAGVARVGSWRLGPAAPPLPTYQGLRAHALGRSVLFSATATP